MNAPRRTALAALAALIALAVDAAATGGAVAARPLDAAPAHAAASDAVRPSRPPEPPPAPSGDPARREYLVFLDDAVPLASYRGGVAGLAATAADLHGDVHLDLGTPAARAYAAHLDRLRRAAIERLKVVAPRADIGWQYHIVAHGFTAALTADEAVAAQRLPGFDLVFPDEALAYEMDSSLDVVGATTAWQAIGGPDNAGRGARIAVMDSGMDVRHPWFRDEGMPPPPDGFPSAQLVGGNATFDYPNPERFVNGKVIAARVFVRNATTQTMQTTTPLTACANPPQVTPTNPNPAPVSCGGNEHGLHVAGIAAGRRGTYDLTFGNLSLPTVMSGVAPMAHLLTYLNANPSNGAVVAGLEQAVKDAVDVVNMSQGTVGWLLARPERHPISIAAEGAADAGTVFAVSAGNAGSNGRTSLSGGWKYSPRILAVGNSTSNGSVDQTLSISGAGVPAEVEQIIGSPRGVDPITTTMTGDLYLSPSGGCLEEAGASGKIVVVDRFGAGTCGYPNRADIMARSGAKAIVFYYNDRNLGGPSAQGLALPAVAVGLRGGKPLMDWLTAGGTGRIEIDGTIARAKSDVADVMSTSSSQGPGLDWQIKPDVAAPGEGTMSSVIFIDRSGQRLYRVDAKSGTSMATPHVSGAVGVLRGAHPDWTVDQIRSAIVNTASPSLKVNVLEPRAAMPYDGGPGRLDVAAALDPGAFLAPTTLSFGRVAEGATVSIPFTIESDLDVAATWTAGVTAGGGTGATVAVEPSSLSIAPGETATLTATLKVASDVPDSEHWGTVNLVTDAGGATHRLRQQYYAYVDRTAARKNVLIVDWAHGSKVDHTAAYTEALEALGLTYDVWVLDNAANRVSAPSLPIRTSHPPLAEMSRYDLVLLNTNESKTSMHGVSLSGLYQYQNHMLRGGSFLIAGQGTLNFWRYLATATRLADNATLRRTYAHTWPFTWAGGPSQNVGCEVCIMRYFTGFTPEYTATLSGRLLVPFPQPVDRTARDVVLEPNPAADPGTPFRYPIDLSTGTSAPEGAAGNQYTFASGSVVTGYKPTTSSTLATGLGDYDYAEGIIDDLVPLARPLWAYTGTFAVDRVNPMTTTTQSKVVGTYVAGQQHPGTGVTWNAMFWGFGLEGLGTGGAPNEPNATPLVGTRMRLLGDAFNFLAHNLTDLTYDVVDDAAPSFELAIDVPEFASSPLIDRAEIDWGDGRAAESVTWSDRVSLRTVRFDHAYAGPGTYTVAMTLYPRADAAPIHLSGDVVAGAARNPVIFLPVTVRGPLGADAAGPGAWFGRRDARR